MRHEHSGKRTFALALPRRLVVCTIALTASGACSVTESMSDAAPADTVDSSPRDAVDAIDAPSLDAIAETRDAFDLAACDGSPFQPGYACLPDPVGAPNAECPYDRFCSDRACPRGCVACPATEFVVGVACIRDVHASADASCPTTRFCQPSDCPSGCVGCVEPLQCVADFPNPDGTPRPCAPDTVCDDADCPSGCHVVA